MMYGYAVLTFHPGTVLVEAVATAALRLLKQFGPQELVNLAWAYAKLGTSYSAPVTEVLQQIFDEVCALTLCTGRESSVLD
jgi:hypothetical protein